MSTIDLVKKIKNSSKKMTRDQRRQRLVSAHIIKENGEYDSKYFTTQTVRASREIIKAS